jgi:DNA-directed RNA polymerase subunit alpha
MITEQEYVDAITVVRNYMAQIINETENGWTVNSKPTLSLILVEQDLSVRCLNCCKYNDLETIGDLVTKTEKQLLHSRNFGKKSLQELRNLLASYGLRFR